MSEPITDYPLPQYAAPTGRAIDGVIVTPLRRIADERGTISHMLRRTDPHFVQFGEIYFSSVYPGVIKAWHLNTQMVLNYACILGRVKLVLFDDRPPSPTRGALMELFLGPDNYCLVTIPQGVWNGFKGMSSPEALIANCASEPHDMGQSVRLDPLRNGIPYDWSLQHK